MLSSSLIFNPKDLIKYNLYMGRLEACPRHLTLFGNQVPTSVNNIKGKYLLKENTRRNAREIGRQYDLTQMSPHLLINELKLNYRDQLADLLFWWNFC